MVFTTSTNGTAAMTPFHSSGAILITAPIRSPPALPPSAYTCPLDVYLLAIKYLAQSIKSVKVLIFFISLPSSYQWRPISSPPRTWAMAYINPLFNKDNLAAENVGSIEAPYDP